MFNQRAVAFRTRDFFIQIILMGCLFFVLTGAAFFLSSGYLKSFRDLHRLLTIVAICGGASVAGWRYIQDRDSFFKLEPIRTIKTFFEIPPLWSVIALYLIFFVTQTVSQILIHAALGTALWDFAFYDQILWNTAHGNFFISSVRGGVSLFIDHFEPIQVLVALIYRMTNSVNIFFAMTTLVTSSTILAAYLITRTLTRSHQTALILSICVFFYQPLVNGINYMFHASMLADPFLLFGFLFVLTKKPMGVVTFFFLALSCKESVAIDVIGISLFLMSRGERVGRWIAALAVVWLAIYGFIEPRGRHPDHLLNYWGLYAHLLNWDLELWKRLLEPNPLEFLFLVLGPFLFLSLKCKGWNWLLGPSLLFRLLSSYHAFRTTTMHQTGGLNALVFISAIYGLTALIGSSDNQKEKKPFLFFRPFANRTAWCIALILAAVVFSGEPQLVMMEKYLRKASHAENQRVIKILESIPENYSVLTSETLSAHLTHRPHLYVFRNVLKNSPLEEAAKHPDLVILDETRVKPLERQDVEDLIQEGYQLIVEVDFAKIFVRPSVDNSLILPDLMSKWELYRKMPGVHYRNVVRFWYLRILIACLILLILFLGHRSLRFTVGETAFRHHMTGGDPIAS